MEIPLATILKAMDALKKSEQQFTAYAEHYMTKDDKDRAVTNYGYAMLCGLAFEQLKLMVERK